MAREFFPRLSRGLDLMDFGISSIAHQINMAIPDEMSTYELLTVHLSNGIEMLATNETQTRAAPRSKTLPRLLSINSAVILQ